MVSMKTEEASENEKEVRRKTRMSELKRRSLCSATVEWKRGAEGERLLSTPLRSGSGERMVVRNQNHVELYYKS